MKKVAFILLLASTITACGGAESKVESVDSVAVDSSAVEQVVVETNAAPIQAADPVGSGGAAEEHPIK